MSERLVPEGYLASNQPDLFFEDNAVGRLKKEVWESSDEEIDAILAEYGVPSPVEWGKPGSTFRLPPAGRWKKPQEERHRFYPGGLHRAAWSAPAKRGRYAVRQCDLRRCASLTANAERLSTWLFLH